MIIHASVRRRRRYHWCFCVSAGPSIIYSGSRRTKRGAIRQAEVGINGVNKTRMLLSLSTNPEFARRAFATTITRDYDQSR
jgi:hypothetical protein